MKIRDKERVEPPHVSIMRKTQTWRLGLRSNMFLDKRPNPAEIPAALLEDIRASWDKLVLAWDEIYPNNPVTSEANHDE